MKKLYENIKDMLEEEPEKVLLGTLLMLLLCGVFMVLLGYFIATA